MSRRGAWRYWRMRSTSQSSPGSAEGRSATIPDGVVMFHPLSADTLAVSELDLVVEDGKNRPGILLMGVYDANVVRRGDVTKFKSHLPTLARQTSKCLPISRV